MTIKNMSATVLATGLFIFAVIMSIMNAAGTGMAWQCYKDTPNSSGTSVKFLLTLMILNVLATFAFVGGVLKG